MNPIDEATSRQQQISDLFLELLKAFRPEVILDIGSLNGGDAMNFKAASIGSKVFAFEANPYNYERAVRAINFSDKGIQFEYLAIAGTDGIVGFNLLDVPFDPEQYDWRHGSSSLLPRLTMETKPILVGSKTLDSFLRERALLDSGKAIWIDVEGAAKIVLSGSTHSLKSALFIKVEVEKRAHWEGQALDTEVLGILREAGFHPVASSNVEGVDQYDVLAVKGELMGLVQRLASSARSCP